MIQYAKLKKEAIGEQIVFFVFYFGGQVNGFYPSQKKTWQNLAEEFRHKIMQNIQKGVVQCFDIDTMPKNK